jgi:hypothetical protein
MTLNTEKVRRYDGGTEHTDWCVNHDHEGKCLDRLLERIVMAQDEPDEVWKRWSRGEGRCPYCIDDEDFHSICDCWYHEKVCDIEGCLGK